MTITKAITKRYENTVDMPYEELLQEGFAAALQGVQRWRKNQGRAAMIAWSWIYVLAKCKELSTSKHSGPEITSYEDRQDTENINATDLYIYSHFADKTAEVDNESGNDAIFGNNQGKEAAFAFLKSALSNGYSDLTQKSDTATSLHQIAAREHVTIQRINQLNRKIENHLLIKT